MANEKQTENQFNKWFKIYDQAGNEARLTYDGTQLTNIVTRIIGRAFSGNVKDPNFWKESIVGSGVIAQGGEIRLNTGIVANSSAMYNTLSLARFITGTSSMNKSVVQMQTPPQLNNIRRWGCFNDSNGFFFQFDGLTFSVGWINAGVVTLVDNGNFNGILSPAIVLDGFYHVYYIIYNQHQVSFYYDQKLLHIVNVTTDNLCNTLDLPCTILNQNYGGNITDNRIDCLALATSRLGELQSESKFFHISGAAATYTLKYGAGKLHKIVFNTVTGTTMTLYDSTGALTGTIGVITLGALAIVGSWLYDLPFDNGLTIVVTGNNLDCTVIYE